MSARNCYEIFAGIIMHFADINKLVFAVLRPFPIAPRHSPADAPAIWLASPECECVRGAFPGILTAEGEGKRQVKQHFCPVTGRK